MEYDNTNKGVMFVRRKSSDKSPDLGGDFHLGGNVLEYILREVQNGNRQIKVSVIGYHGHSRKGDPMTNLRILIPDDNRPNFGNRGNFAQPQGRQQNFNQGQQADRVFGGGAPGFMRQPAQPPQQNTYAQQSGGGFGNSGAGATPRGRPEDLDDTIPF